MVGDDSKTAGDDLLLRSRLKDNPGLIPDKGFWYEANITLLRTPGM